MVKVRLGEERGGGGGRRRGGPGGAGEREGEVE